MRNSKVYLIGAGPGNPGLITVRALEILRKAEVLVYDQLGTAAFLEEIPENCQLYDVGKSAGNHKLSQDEINSLLAKKANEFKTVVRLKGGDPYVFGRGGEEYLYLKERNIGVEVVPGVTSAISAPCFAGIPITQRGYTASLAVVTGHEAEKEKSQINWKALSGIGTVVFLMGVKNISKICKNLIDCGRSPDTPVAMIQNGTLFNQKSYFGTLATIESVVKENEILPPCVTVVGEVVKLHEQLNWFEKLPLFGKKIVVTRSRTQASNLVMALRELGADTIECPTIKIRPIEDNRIFYDFLKDQGSYTHLVFTSVNGVCTFSKKLLESKKDFRILSGKKIVCIGSATAAALEERGILADYVPEEYVAESLVKFFEREEKSKVAILRAEKAREILPESLKSFGHDVNVIPLYHTEFETEIDSSLLESIKEKTIDYVTFTSSSTVEGFARLIDNYGISHDNIPAAAIGPITAASCQKQGFELKLMAGEHSIPGLVEAIKQRESK